MSRGNPYDKAQLIYENLDFGCEGYIFKDVLNMYADFLIFLDKHLL